MDTEKKYKVLIAEDEKPARSLLKSFIERRSEIEIADVAVNGKEALDKLSQFNKTGGSCFDLILLDIDMPVLSGIDVIERAKVMPYIIFTTAHDNYALNAFDWNAIDFLHKPFSVERFNRAINKFLNIIGDKISYETDCEIKEMRPDKYRKSTLSEEKAEIFSDKLLQYMDKEKAYVDPDISLQVLAENLSISSHHLSQVINQRLKKKYYEFINEYRVKEAERELVCPNNQDKTIYEISLDVGFKSKSVFNSVFKEYIGMTPTQYRKKS